MAAIDDKQRSTADWLVRQIRDAQPDRPALFNLAGAVGSGKTAVLRLVAESLPKEGLVPLMVAAPAGEIDAAPIALVETASQMKAASLLNGESLVLSDPQRPWAEKMEAVTAALDRHRSEVVILCDEPTRWYARRESLFDDTPDACARSFAEWIAKDASCRRIITGRVPDDIAPHERTRAPRLDDGRAFLTENHDWGSVTDLADSLLGSLPRSVPYRSVWEMKLSVALCRFKGVADVARQTLSDTSADAYLEELLDLMEDHEAHRLLCTALARLAVPRTALGQTVFKELTLDLPDEDRSLIEACLCNWEQGRFSLHPLVRQEVVKRARDPRRWDKAAQWQLPSQMRQAVHRRLKIEYPPGQAMIDRSQLESLHHDLLGDAWPLAAADARLFVEQLHEIGRTLSHVHHEHRRAADLFRFTLSLTPGHPYSHHYLAFNLDWLAEEPEQVEHHYREAIRLQPTHPWWWSRWISYLATRGRFRDARSEWREALDSLSVSEDATPDWLFLSLHRWVARWLLHWGELDFAEEVLHSIPTEMVERDTSIQALHDLLAALRAAERGVAVFPLTVPAQDWWSHHPHTDLPLTWQDVPLRSWLPGRVEAVDQESQTAFLVVAKRPAAADVEPEYMELELTRGEVDSAAHRFHAEQLVDGSFVELGYYGDNEAFRMGLHRTTEWRDRRLIPLVPPPDRWYRRAIVLAQKSAEARD